MSPLDRSSTRCERTSCSHVEFVEQVQRRHSPFLTDSRTSFLCCLFFHKTANYFCGLKKKKQNTKLAVRTETDCHGDRTNLMSVVGRSAGKKKALFSGMFRLLIVMGGATMDIKRECARREFVLPSLSHAATVGQQKLDVAAAKRVEELPFRRTFIPASKLPIPRRIAFLTGNSWRRQRLLSVY